MDDTKPSSFAAEELNKRVNKWLSNTELVLDLSNLGLKSWPTILNPHLDKIIKLDCYLNQLTTLPALPECTELECSVNQLSALPTLPKCTRVYCYSNQLTALPDLPKCINLNCSFNRLMSLSSLPECTDLDCSVNKLSTLPTLPKCTRLWCAGNRLFSDDLLRWRKVWRWLLMRQLRRCMTRLFRIIRFVRLRLHLPRKNQLHLELLYSPYHPGKFYMGERKSNQWSDVFLQHPFKNTSK